MNKANKLSVVYNGMCVGTLALYRNYCSAFEYSDEWIANGFSISPFSLPLEKKVFIPNVDPFEGLFGVFSDSLPDGWGRLLVDRLLKKKGIEPHVVTSLDRLAIGMNPDIEDILAIAENIGINRKKAKNIALSIYECVQEELREWID